MIYKAFQDLQLSALGLGTMRLPTVDGKDADIDKAQTAQMVDYAMAHGINYYDTAWCYHGGNSEVVMGELLEKYPRESFYLADKFPGFIKECLPKVKEIFEEQLKRCRVEYFDFYLFHNVNEANIDAYLDPELGIFDYLMEQKRLGRIRHLGFSAHGRLPVIRRFLERYGDAMEFGQLQLNWLDWEFQEVREKVELLNEYHIPVWVMEPLRGGRLCKLEPEQEARLQALRPETMTQWAFRFPQSLPEVTVTLSGMSNMEQLQENIATYEVDKPLNSQEIDTLLALGREITGKIALPCTGCRYCTDHCPQGLDIPLLLKLYNENCFTEGDFMAGMVLGTMPEDKQPSCCVGCRSCEQVCPQGLKISEAMKDFTKRLQ